MSFGYGVTKERTISEHVLKLAMRYAHQRLSKWCDLDISETTCYGVVRSALHNRIAEALDCDRELVEEAFTRACIPFGCRIFDTIAVDGTMKNDEDFTKIYDSFCDNLLEIALRENDEDRHPNIITKAQLDEIEKNQLIGIPSLTNN